MPPGLTRAQDSVTVWSDEPQLIKYSVRMQNAEKLWRPQYQTEAEAEIANLLMDIVLTNVYDYAQKFGPSHILTSIATTKSSQSEIPCEG